MQLAVEGLADVHSLPCIHDVTLYHGKQIFSVKRRGTGGFSCCVCVCALQNLAEIVSVPEI